MTQHNMKTIRPMKAIVPKDYKQIRFPVLATPKVDGIRCLILNGQAVSQKLLPIPNDYIRLYLSHLKNGYDGEIVVPGGFNATQSAVMSRDGCPPFQYLVFDKIANLPYQHRIREVKAEFACVRCSFASPLLPDLITDLNMLYDAEETAINAGWEGLIIRQPNGPYKFGRSTWTEQYMLKIKQFQDAEATVIGFVEQLHNANEAQTDELGLTKRSKALSGLVPAGTLGALKVRGDDGTEFEIGSGFTDSDRRDIWLAQGDYLGRRVTYKFMPYGMKDKPRHPIYKGFRGD